MADWVDSLTKANNFVNAFVIQVSDEERELACRYMIRHNAEDLLEMLGL